jgi:hypothetical protein
MTVAYWQPILAGSRLRRESATQQQHRFTERDARRHAA